VIPRTVWSYHVFLVLDVTLRILSDLPACRHVTSPTTTNSFALTIQCNDKKHSNSRHGMACRILKVGYIQTFLFAFQYNYCNYVQPRERSTLHRRNFPNPSLIQSSLLHYSAGQKRVHQNFRNDVRQKKNSLKRQIRMTSEALRMLRNVHTLVWETDTTFTKACATSFSAPAEALPTPRDCNLQCVVYITTRQAMYV
jgi:hypothetical protein